MIYIRFNFKGPGIVEDVATISKSKNKNIKRRNKYFICETLNNNKINNLFRNKC